MVMTQSASCAAAPALSAHFAPCASRASAFCRVREQTVSACPALIKFAAMRWPMMPVPINAIFISLPFSLNPLQEMNEVLVPFRPGRLHHLRPFVDLGADQGVELLGRVSGRFHAHLSHALDQIGR